jgi:hypothetical protein
LDETARTVGRHPDLCPADWLVAAADRLRAEAAA